MRIVYFDVLLASLTERMEGGTPNDNNVMSLPRENYSTDLGNRKAWDRVAHLSLSVLSHCIEVTPLCTTSFVRASTATDVVEILRSGEEEVQAAAAGVFSNMLKEGMVTYSQQALSESMIMHVIIDHFARLEGPSEGSSCLQQNLASAIEELCNCGATSLGDGTVWFALDSLTGVVNSSHGEEALVNALCRFFNELLQSCPTPLPFAWSISLMELLPNVGTKRAEKELTACILGISSIPSEFQPSGKRQRISYEGTEKMQSDLAREVRKFLPQTRTAHHASATDDILRLRPFFWILYCIGDHDAEQEFIDALKQALSSINASDASVSDLAKAVEAASDILHVVHTRGIQQCSSELECLADQTWKNAKASMESPQCCVFVLKLAFHSRCAGIRMQTFDSLINEAVGSAYPEVRSALTGLIPFDSLTASIEDGDSSVLPWWKFFAETLLDDEHTVKLFAAKMLGTAVMMEKLSGFVTRESLLRLYGSMEDILEADSTTSDTTAKSLQAELFALMRGNSLCRVPIAALGDGNLKFSIKKVLKGSFSTPLKEACLHSLGSIFRVSEATDLEGCEDLVEPMVECISSEDASLRTTVLQESSALLSPSVEAVLSKAEGKASWQKVFELLRAYLGSVQVRHSFFGRRCRFLPTFAS